jgi:hypothetical protein
MKLKLINEIINKEGFLTPITQKLLQLAHLNQIWKDTAESHLACNSIVANFHQGVLTIELTSPVWATNLRYATPDLVRKLALHPDFSQLTQIRWYIQPRVDKKTEAAKTLTIESAQILQSYASNIDNKSLKAALLRLANFHRNVSGN